MIAAVRTRHVPSESREGVVYTVHIGAHGVTCSCPGYEVYGYCKHREEIMTQEMESKALVPLAVQPPARPLPARREIDIMMALSHSVIKARGHAVPKDLDTPEKAFAVMLAGWELGCKPMTSLRHIFVINGRTEPSSQLMMGVVRARDGSAQFVFHETTAQACDVELRRSGHPPLRLRYTVEDAKRSGQVDRPGPWQHYPADMLRWAAIKRVCRLGAPDLINAIGGIDIAEAADIVEYERGVEAQPAGEAIETSTEELYSPGDDPTEEVAEAPPLTAEPTGPASKAFGIFATPEGELDWNAYLAHCRRHGVAGADLVAALGREATRGTVVTWLRETGQTVDQLTERATLLAVERRKQEGR